MAKRRARKPAAVTRYAPASRLHGLRALLDGPEGVSIYDVAERFEVNPRTALRYIQALQRAGEPLYEELVGKRKVWRLMPTARRQSITLTTAQMVALYLSRRVFDFLAGTGFKEDLDDVFAKLEATLRRKDFAAVAQPGSQSLRRERGAPPLRRPHRGRERHHDGAACARSGCASRTRACRAARRPSCSSRTRCSSTRRASI